MTDPSELLLDPKLLDEPVEPRRLLLVEDESAVRRLMRRIFEDAYEVYEAADGREGLERAREIEPAVVIADQRMPEITGVELLSRVRDELPHTVRVLVTGYNDYGPVVSAVNAANIHSYFEKPFHRDDLRTVVDALVRNAELEAQRDLLLDRLREAVQILQDSNRELQAKEASLERTVDERTQQLIDTNRKLRSANRKLEHLAVRDGLTGLFNHRSLMEHLDLEVARSSRYQRQFAVLFLDLDDFKQVNDEHGHRVGDAVLRRVASLLQEGPQGLRRSDFSARYGGEEFCVILPETSLAGGVTKAERLREAVARQAWEREAEGLQAQVTVSVGVAAYPQHGGTAEALLEAADSALYTAKRTGKNRVVAGDVERTAPLPGI